MAASDNNATVIASNSVGNSLPINTIVALINAPGPGRFKVWGTTRHSLADGLKFTSPVTIPLPGTPNAATDFGPIIFDIPNNTAAITISLAVATGASDTASALICAQRIDQNR